MCPKTTVTIFLRRTGLAAFFLVSLSAGATAQTVIVRHPPDVATIELFLNQIQAASVPISPDNTRLTGSLLASLRKTETDIDVFIDRCVTKVRVALTERGAAPVAPDASCTRQQAPGLFRLREVTTFVIDLSSQNPVLLVAQGAPPRQWLRDEVPLALRPPRDPPLGFAVLAGMGPGFYSNFDPQACGDVTDCSGQNSITMAAGAVYWFTQNLAAEASYVRPSAVTATGIGTSLQFDSTFDPEFLVLVANVGGMARNARIYAKGGMDYHRATFSTNQTVDDRTSTTSGVTTTLTGGTQTLVLQSAGWGIAFGAGFEIWPNKHFAVYGEGLSLGVKGGSRDGADGEADDRVNVFMAGIRIRLGK
jgi:hypothetical protein